MEGARATADYLAAGPDGSGRGNTPPVCLAAVHQCVPVPVIAQSCLDHPH